MRGLLWAVPFGLAFWTLIAIAAFADVLVTAPASPVRVGHTLKAGAVVCTGVDPVEPAPRVSRARAKASVVFVLERPCYQSIAPLAVDVIERRNDLVRVRVYLNGDQGMIGWTRSVAIAP